MAKRGAKLGTSVLDLDIDDSKFHSKLRVAAKTAEEWTAKAATGMMKAGKAISGVGTSMTRNITLPILAAGGAVAHFALDFDTTMRRIVGLAKVPKEEIAGVADSIKKMATEVGRSPQELGKAFYFVASAGFKAGEAMKVLEIAAKASAAGMGEVQDIAKVLGGVINAYGHENLSAARAGDILTAAIQDGSAEAADFAGSIGMVVPSAAALGVSFDQVTAAMSAMTNVGISADTAATNLGQVFSALQKPTAQAEAAMTGLGLSSAGLRQELKEKGLLATLRTLEERFGGNEVAAAAVFGNIRALRGVTALLSLDTAQLNGIFGDTEAALGNLQQAYDDTDGPQRRIDKAMAKLQVAAIGLGADVLPMLVDVLQKVADAASGLADWWSNLDKGTRSLIVSSLAWLAIAGPVLLVVGKLTSGAGALLKVVSTLAGAKGLGAVAGVAGRSRLAMLGWAGALVVAYEAAKIGTGFLDDFLDTLSHGAKANKELKALESIVGDRNLAGRLRELGITAKQMGELVEKAGGNVGDAVHALSDSAGDFGKAMFKLSLDADPTKVFGGWGTRDPTKIKAALADADAAASDAAGDIPKVVAAKLIDGQFEVSEAAQTGEVDPIIEALAKAKQDVADAANDLIHTLATTLASNPQELQDAAKAMWEDILHPFPDIKQRLQIEGILANKTLIAGLTSTDSGDRARTAEYIKGLLADYELLAPGVLAAGEELNPALRQGIENTLDALKTYLATVGVDITDQFALADELDRQGYASLAGYVRGLERARLGAMTTELTNAQRLVHEKLDQNLYTSGQRTAESYGKGLASMGGFVADQARFIAHRVGGFLAFSGSPAYTHSREIGEGVGESYGKAIATGIAGSLSAIRSGVGSVGDALTFGTQIQMPTLAGGGMDMAGSRSAAPAGTGGGGMMIEGGIHIAINGVGSDVSPAAARQFGQQVMDEFAARLRDQASQVVRVRPVVP